MLLIVFVMFFALVGASSLVDGSGVRFDVALVPDFALPSISRHQAEAIYDQLESAIQTAARATGQTLYLPAYKDRLDAWHNKNFESMHAIRQGFSQEAPDRDAIKGRIQEIWWDFGEEDFDILNSIFFFENQVDRIHDAFLRGLATLEGCLKADNIFFGERYKIHSKEIDTQRARERQKADQVPSIEHAFLQNMINVYRGIADHLRRVLDRHTENDHRFAADVAAMMREADYSKLKEDYDRVVRKIMRGEFKDTLARGDPDYNWGLPFHRFSFKEALSELYSQNASCADRQPG